MHAHLIDDAAAEALEHVSAALVRRDSGDEGVHLDALGEQPAEDLREDVEALLAHDPRCPAQHERILVDPELPAQLCH